ncbi:hypothetical protein DFJ74DRAFT_649983 [Hyaloraphidium curvatum]|nr:hypothetical protein DFJ74DRAFT_649983 [Hyaloraphidium curvatum]
MLVIAVADALHALDGSCPHIGKPLDLGDIEDITLSLPDGTSETGPAIVCPAHFFDFSLASGRSSGCPNSAVVYTVAPLADGAVEIGGIWQGEIGQELGEEFECLAREVVPKKPIAVPEASAEEAEDVSNNVAGTAVPDLSKLNLEGNTADPTDLLSGLRTALLTPNLAAKAALILRLKTLFDEGLPVGPRSAYTPPDVPPREADVLFVDPKRVRRRGFGSEVGRLAMLHALANVEGWAMDLGCDVMLRFASYRLAGPGPDDGEDGMPPRAFFADFLKLSAEEAKHFSLLAARLAELGSPFPSKDFPCHLGLWDAAASTASDLMDRLALVHMVHEARGLDVNPGTISKFAAAGDAASAAMLKVIHEDEVTHVAAGVRWFEAACKARGLDPVAEFRGVLDRQRNGRIRPPYNEADRDRAGMARAYYVDE